MNREPAVGFDPGSPGSSHGPKAGAKPLRHPGMPSDPFCKKTKTKTTHQGKWYEDLDSLRLWGGTDSYTKCAMHPALLAIVQQNRTREGDERERSQVLTKADREQLHQNTEHPPYKPEPGASCHPSPLPSQKEAPDEEGTPYRSAALSRSRT